MRDVEQAIERYYRPPPPRPPRDEVLAKQGLNKGKREGGCTLVVKGLEPESESSYLGVTAPKKEILRRIREMKLKGNHFIEVERNDFSIYSGQVSLVNPEYIITII